MMLLLVEVVLACCRPLFLVWLRCWFCIAAAAAVVAGSWSLLLRCWVLFGLLFGVGDEAVAGEKGEL